MLDFKKEHDYLICIDSDGTVMDTMTVKHETSFGPEFVNVFGIKEHVQDILTYWNDYNLYKKTRGINRFLGLKEILLYVKKYNISFEGEEDFLSWTENTSTFSNDALKKEIERKGTFTLKKALEWSNAVNASIAKLPPSQAFKGVKEALEELSKNADLVGVSSANKDAVYEEWNRLDLMKFFKYVACQDIGSKGKIIQEALKENYKLENSLMVGDALGDYEAANQNGIKFFPITPKKEVESWERLKKEGIEKLESNSFDDKYQKELFDEFLNNLK